MIILNKHLISFININLKKQYLHKSSNSCSLEFPDEKIHLPFIFINVINDKLTDFQCSENQSNSLHVSPVTFFRRYPSFCYPSIFLFL